MTVLMSTKIIVWLSGVEIIINVMIQGGTICHPKPQICIFISTGEEELTL